MDEVNGVGRKTLTVAEVAKILGVGRNAAYEAARNGQLPAIRIGKRLLISSAAFERLLAFNPTGEAAR